MGLFSKKIGAVFLKETSDVQEFILKMQKLQEHAIGDVKKEIKKQIKLASYGEIGEKNIAFELKNSDMDMYILHDIYLEIGDFSAQIDYIVITRKCTYIIECKNLIGNIEIDSEGNFIRTYELFGKKIKEGIYSPITQNQRHLLLIKEIRKENISNKILSYAFEKHFGEYHKSIVVLANPKTCLNVKRAKKEIKEQVIRADQLIAYIKKRDNNITENTNNLDYMYKLAEFYMKANQSKKSDYAKKYEEIVADSEMISLTKSSSKEKIIEPVATYPNIKMEKKSKKIALIQSEESTIVKESKNKNITNAEIVVKLKAYRLEKSRKEKIKPYFIFNNVQMNDLIIKNPKSEEELLNISGFGNVKVEKYGAEILELLKNYNKI